MGLSPAKETLTKQMITVSEIAINSTYILPGREVKLVDVTIDGQAGITEAVYDLKINPTEAVRCRMPLADFLRSAELAPEEELRLVLSSDPKAAPVSYKVKWVVYCMVAPRGEHIPEIPVTVSRKVWDMQYAGDARYKLLAEFEIEEELF